MLISMNGVIGVDEVGRGAWAGPVCVGAVRLAVPIAGLKDSKKLGKSQRERLALAIRQQAEVGLGWATAREVDRHGLTMALGLAMERALLQFEGDAPVLLDGSVNYLPARLNLTTMIKADDHEPAVSAASIVAKVARDQFMTIMSRKFQAYGFEQHVGYGTAFHREMISLLGPCLFHRQSFTPVAQAAMM